MNTLTTKLGAKQISTAAALPQGGLSGGPLRLVPGLLLSSAVAVVGIELGKIGWLAAHGMSALTLAIVFGMLVGNTVYPWFAGTTGAGVTFSKQMLLRAGVVLYGLRLTLHDIGHVGTAGVVIDTLVLGSTFALACVLGTRVFKLDRTTAMLIGAGSSICGAAAVMATEPVVRGRSEQVTVAVSTVVVFGTLAIFLYPALYDLNNHWHLIGGGQNGFGIYAGSTIHEVAQVVAAARSISVDAAHTAVIAKMVRVMMLAPFLIGLSVWLARAGRRSAGESNRTSKTKLAIPWFAFAFVGVVLLNSFVRLPHQAIGLTNDVDTFLLAMAMGALGLTTHLSAIRKAGIKPLLLGAVLFAWLVGGGALINSLVMHWFG